jgi:ferredoxin
MKAFVDWAVCEGTGYCVRMLPSVFAFDNDGMVQVNQEEAQKSGPGSLEEAEQLCPTGAIFLEEDAASS